MRIKKEIRLLVYDKYNKKCAYCGDSIEYNEMQVDHIIPKFVSINNIENYYKPEYLSHINNDTLDHIDNLNPSCRVCNKWKNANSLKLFRSEIEEQLVRLNKYNSNYRFAKKYNLIEEKPKKVKFYFENFL